MSDPFLQGPNNKPIALETKVGFGVVSVVILGVALWGWGTFSQQFSSIPLHIQNAPVAKHVGPDYYLKPLEQRDRQLISNVKSNEVPNPAAETGSIEKVSMDPVQSSVSPPRLVQQSKESVENPIVQSLKKQDRIVLEENEFSGPSIKPSRDISNDYVHVADSSNSLENRTSSPQIRQGNAETKATVDPNVETVSYDQPVNEDLGKSKSNSGNDFKPSMPVKREHNIDVAQRHVDNDESEFVANTTNTLEDEDLKNLKLEVIDPPVSDQDSIELPNQEIASKTQTEPFSNLTLHVSDRGESFWTIAQQYYDDGRFFRALYQYNRERVSSFDNLPEGTEIEIPKLSKLKLQFPGSCPSSANEFDDRYHTRDGDTLFDIARQATGQASNYLEIIRLNKRELPLNVTHLTRLPAGISLQLPQR